MGASGLIRKRPASVGGASSGDCLWPWLCWRAQEGVWCIRVLSVQCTAWVLGKGQFVLQTGRLKSATTGKGQSAADRVFPN